MSAPLTWKVLGNWIPQAVEHFELRHSEIWQECYRAHAGGIGWWQYRSPHFPSPATATVG